MNKKRFLTEVKLMNVLLRFEDKYGCCSLFKYCNSILNSQFYKAENLNVSVENGLTCNGVFFLDSNLIDNYDFVIIVFDMDNSEDGYGCLTTEILKQRLENFLVSKILI